MSDLDLDQTIGLCARCLHARQIESRRGSVFWRCGRAEADDRFAKYPPLPVLRCAGFENEPETKGPQ